MKNNWARYISGYAAIIASLYCLYRFHSIFPVFLAFLFLLVVCITDTFYAKIPNVATLSLVTISVGYHFYVNGAEGILFSMTGLIAGLALYIIPYAMGGMGAGDVKALASLGSLMGVSVIFQIFLYASLIGFFLAILHILFDRNLKKRIAKWKAAVLVFAATWKVRHLGALDAHEKLKFPYVSAITFGFFAYVTLGNII